MHQRRSSKRLPSILQGHINLDGEMTRIICTVRDLSASGARIWFPDPINLPSEFNLEIPWVGQTARVRLAWSKGRTHGLMFLSELRPEPAPTADSLSGELLQLDDAGFRLGHNESLRAQLEVILGEARCRIAEVVGVPAKKIRLLVKIAPRVWLTCWCLMVSCRCCGLVCHCGPPSGNRCPARDHPAVPDEKDEGRRSPVLKQTQNKL